jgi:hypothetical protein
MLKLSKKSQDETWLKIAQGIEQEIPGGIDCISKEGEKEDTFLTFKF